MRLALVLAAATALSPIVAAEAQTMSRQSGTWVNRGQMPHRPMTQPMRPMNGGWKGNGGVWKGNTGQRWGGMVQGRWYGGMHAPGGWNAYRQPVRGWALPSYWTAPSFVVYDWSNYGLGAPQQGYSWYRYYDDAVLADSRGRVYDSVRGVDWNAGYADQQSYTQSYDVDDATYAQAPIDGGYYDDAAHAGADYRPVPPPPPLRDERRRGDNGIGGALIGGAVGGVAGNLIAGRGNRLAGTLIGAGAGAIAGAVIDDAEDRGPRRRDRDYVPVAPDGPPPPRGYAPSAGAGYPPPPPYVEQGRSGYGQPSVVRGGPGGGTVVVTNSGGGYYGGTTTTVVVQPSVTTTETVTEYVYETAPVRHVRKAVRRPVRCKCVLR